MTIEDDVHPTTIFDWARFRKRAVKIVITYLDSELHTISSGEYPLKELDYNPQSDVSYETFVEKVAQHYGLESCNKIFRRGGVGRKLGTLFSSER